MEYREKCPSKQKPGTYTPFLQPRLQFRGCHPPGESRLVYFRSGELQICPPLWLLVYQMWTIMLLVWNITGCVPMTTKESVIINSSKSPCSLGYGHPGKPLRWPPLDNTFGGVGEGIGYSYTMVGERTTIFKVPDTRDPLFAESEICHFPASDIFLLTVNRNPEG
jgi:hypothetical protein